MNKTVQKDIKLNEKMSYKKITESYKRPVLYHVMFKDGKAWKTLETNSKLFLHTSKSKMTWNKITCLRFWY